MRALGAKVKVRAGEMAQWWRAGAELQRTRVQFAAPT